jgi:OFA family oxalate/formate antiporter-like MFS transporter
VAWGIGGVVSPLLITYLRQTTGSYRLPIGILAVVMLVAVVLPLMIRPPAKRVPLK